MIFCPIMCRLCIFLVWAYVYMDSWIRCQVDLYAFFLRCFNILCYASGFYILLFVVRCLWCARACVLFIGIVQRNWACLTWKSAIEIKSLLLLLLLLSTYITHSIHNTQIYIHNEHIYTSIHPHITPSSLGVPTSTPPSPETVFKVVFSLLSASHTPKYIVNNILTHTSTHTYPSFWTMW